MAYTTINKSTDYFNTKLYTGNGSTQSITGVGFQPDWVWLKSRSNAQGHNLFDAVRGVNKPLFSDDSNGEATTTDRLSLFDSDGFTLGSNTNVNNTGYTYASWNWLGANGTASNTDGSITSTVSANTTSGFSIVSYTGTANSSDTVGHGLGVVPKMIIIKRRDGAGGTNWCVYHVSNNNTKVMFLESTSSGISNVRYWNNTTPTSSVFTIGNDSSLNASGGTFVAYCFADIKGFSKFGSYVGNGNADGTFVYTGFKPAFFLFKRTDGANSWGIMDNKRSTSGANEIDKGLKPDSANAEYTGFNKIDFTSNGIKLKSTDSDNNASGASYIYMAFAEEPLVGDNPCTAR